MARPGRMGGVPEQVAIGLPADRLSDDALPPLSEKNMLTWVPRSNSGKVGAFILALARPTA